jgi:hypothetical protein
LVSSSDDERAARPLDFFVLQEHRFDVIACNPLNLGVFRAIRVVISGLERSFTAGSVLAAKLRVP